MQNVEKRKEIDETAKQASIAAIPHWNVGTSETVRGDLEQLHVLAFTPFEADTWTNHWKLGFSLILEQEFSHQT